MVNSSWTLDSQRDGLYPALLLRSSVILATELRKYWGKEGHSQQRGSPGELSLRGLWPSYMQSTVVQPTVWLHGEVAPEYYQFILDFQMCGIWSEGRWHRTSDSRILPENETQTCKSAVQSSAGRVARKQSQLLWLWSPAPCVTAGGCTESVFSWESGVVMSALHTWRPEMIYIKGLTQTRHSTDVGC